VGIFCGLAFLILAIPVVLFIGAVFLRVACAICRVEAPETLKSMGIVFTVAASNAALLGLVRLMLGDSAKSLEIAELVSTPLQMFAGAALYMLFIPTSFYRGILIWLLWYIVLVTVVLGTVFVVMMIFAALI